MVRYFKWLVAGGISMYVVGGVLFALNSLVWPGSLRVWFLAVMVPIPFWIQGFRHLTRANRLEQSYRRDLEVESTTTLGRATNAHPFLIGIGIIVAVILIVSIAVTQIR
jgi:hypothetical protein